MRPVVDVMLEATLALDAPGLERSMRRALSERGTLAFIEQVALPFLAELGDRWERNEVQLFQEHFASEKLTAFLSRQWYSARAGDRGHVVLAGLEDEAHVLGLHMAAMVFTDCGWNPIFLGRDTPADQIAACTAQVRAHVVGVTASVHTDSDDAHRKLRALRDALPPDVELLVGGGGAVDVTGCVRLTSLRDLAARLD